VKQYTKQLSTTRELIYRLQSGLSSPVLPGTGLSGIIYQRLGKEEYVFRLHKRLGSSRIQIGIQGIKDDLLLLPHNTYCLVMQTSSINFELQSDAEKDITISNFQQFLNSLSIPLQIIVRTRKLDVDQYMRGLEKTPQKRKVSPLMRSQKQNYQKFLASLITNNQILSRSFYLVISLSDVKSNIPETKEKLLFHGSIIQKELGKMGIKVTNLNNKEILQIFYTFYNPGKVKQQPIQQEYMTQLTTYGELL
jgi:hypothetical protein